MLCVEVVACLLVFIRCYRKVNAEIDIYPKLPYYESWGEADEIEFLFFHGFFLSYELLVMSFEFNYELRISNYERGGAWLSFGFRISDLPLQR